MSLDVCITVRNENFYLPLNKWNSVRKTGYILYTKLGRFEDPAFVIRQAVVITPYPGASPEHVAIEIKDKKESAIQPYKSLGRVWIRGFFKVNATDANDS